MDDLSSDSLFERISTSGIELLERVKIFAHDSSLVEEKREEHQRPGCRSEDCQDLEESISFTSSDTLFEVSLCPNAPESFQLIMNPNNSFSEVIKERKSITSLQRIPDKQDNFVRGHSSNTFFLPGGADERRKHSYFEKMAAELVPPIDSSSFDLNTLVPFTSIRCHFDPEKDQSQKQDDPSTQSSDSLAHESPYTVVDQNTKDYVSFFQFDGDDLLGVFLLSSFLLSSSFFSLQFDN